MVIEAISVTDFRNFSAQKIDMDPGITILYGDNAQGKTNFLEALYLCGTGRSWRTKQDRELVAFDKKEAHLTAKVINQGLKDTIDLHLSRDSKKSIRVNQLGIKKLGELYGILMIVVFSPEDLSLVKAGPGERRKFLDVELCQLNKVYYYHLKQYYHILKQRNNLLKTLAKNKGSAPTLEVWDEQLVHFGSKIIADRLSFVEELSLYAQEIHKVISGSRERLTITYKPHTLPEEWAKKLVKNRERDIFTGATGNGAHKDDLLFAINGHDIRVYGSQGQQRSACLSAKLAEIRLIRERTGLSPVLLLDDVLSELDEGRQRFLLSCIGDIQTCITATGIEDVLQKIQGKAKIFKVTEGVLSLSSAL